MDKRCVSSGLIYICFHWITHVYCQPMTSGHVILCLSPPFPFSISVFSISHPSCLRQGFIKLLHRLWGLEFVILLSPVPHVAGFRHAPPHLANFLWISQWGSHHLDPFCRQESAEVKWSTQAQWPALESRLPNFIKMLRHLLVNKLNSSTKKRGNCYLVQFYLRVWVFGTVGIRNISNC